jgi:hypothetical protein
MNAANNEHYFRYSATLRIFGDIPDLAELTRRLGVSPTHAHRRGDPQGSILPPYEQDAWNYTAPIQENEQLHVHVDALWNTFRERKQVLLQLKEIMTVDVFLGYRSDCDHAGVELPWQSLEMFVELQVPFGISIIVV